MNILLTNGLPEEIDGVPIFSDFRNMIQVELLLHDEELSPQERTFCALMQLYDVIPSDTQKAIDGLMWFYGRGDNKEGSQKSGSPTKRAIDFEQDANIIYASFFSAYHINLCTIDYMHWWEFMALIEGLPDTSLMSRIMYWRTADVSKMDKFERKQVLKMRERFAIKGNPSEKLTPEELKQKTRQNLAQKFALAKQKLESQQ